MPLQPIPSTTIRSQPSTVRGLQVFRFEAAAIGRENSAPLINSGGVGTGNSISGESSSSDGKRKRKMVIPSVVKNRKNGGDYQGHELALHPSKKSQIGVSGEFVDVQVVAAEQPHRSQ